MKEHQAGRVIALLGALSWVMAVLLSGGGARADEAAVDAARTRFKEGVALFDKKKYDEARVAFLEAYALKKHPAVLLNLAQSELRSGHEVDAAKHFSQFLQEAVDATPAQKKSAEAGLKTATASLVVLSIDVDVPGAEVYLDGKLQGTSPLPGPVLASKGPHLVEARKDGKSTRSDLYLSAAEASVPLELGAATTPEGAPATATPEQATATPAEAPPPTPQELPPPAPAPSTAAEATGREPFFHWVTHRPIGLVGLGLTGVGLAGGIVFAITAKTAYDNGNRISAQITSQAVADTGLASPGNPCNPNPTAWSQALPQPVTADKIAGYADACKRYQDDIDLGDKQKVLSIVGFAVAGVAAVGTVVIYLTDGHARPDKEKPSPSQALLVPVIGPTERGLALVGTF